MKETTTAYPLQWPAGWSRTAYPEKSKFNVTSFARLRNELKKSLELMGAKYPVISTNLPLNSSGDATSKFAQPQDKGVAVYFEYRGKQMVFACDRWNKVEDNVRAIHNTIDAIRGIERWGASDMLERAFTGFAQLAAPPSEEWWDILQCRVDSSMETIKMNYRRLAKERHPDSGGTSEAMTKLNQAFDKATKSR